jgi:hypothetical protein
MVGALATLLPVMKITGVGIFPALAVAGVVFGLRWDSRTTLKWFGAAGASAMVAALLWVFIAAPLLGGEKGRLVNTHPGAVPTASATMVAATKPAASTPEVLSTTPVGRLQYFVKTFIPPAPGPRRWALTGENVLQRWPAFRIYIDRGYGFYGWQSTSGLPFNTLVLILVGLAAGWALSLAAAFQRRRAWREWSGEALFLFTCVLSVLAFVGYAYAKPNVVSEPGEQGRYVFTALVPLAVLFSGSMLALRGRLAALALGAGVSAAWTVGAIGWLTALRGWYI